MEDNLPSTSSSKEEKVIQLNDSKAGMEGLDLEKINKIINDTSRGSKFYEHKKKRQEQLNQKVIDMKVLLAALSPEMIAKAEKQVDVISKEMEEKRELSRVIVCLDMDAFFASVEMRDNPSLKDVPMAVGGNSMLSTSNYHARRYGVRAAMPGFIAKKLCPHLIIVPGHYEKYSAASKEVEQVLMEYDKETLSMSMDEAVIDITQCLAERNSMASEHSQITAAELVHEMRNKVFEKTKLTASAGIAANGFLAKICSDVNKPNNQFYLEPRLEVIEAFLKDLPIRKVCGIGPVTEHLLKGLDINTCKDLWGKRGIINLLFKPATSSFLLAVSKGIGSSFFSFAPESEDIRKSMSCERTFGKASKEDLKQMCHELSQELQKDLENKGASGKTITLKIKTVDFVVKTRARSISEYTSNASVLFENGWSIYNSYEKEIPSLKLRLLGLRISNLRFSSDEEEEGGSMKQTTLSQCFSKSKQLTSRPKEYPCPCCRQEFTSMRELDIHVDDCLINSETESSKDQKIPVDNSSSLVSVTCPVCNHNIRFKSEEEMESKMNIHIDECLNICAVKEMVSLEKRKSEDSQQAASSTSSPLNVNPMKRSLEIKQEEESKTSSKHEPNKNNEAPRKTKKLRSMPIHTYFKRGF